jgi:hypothetical protein
LSIGSELLTKGGFEELTTFRLLGRASTESGLGADRQRDRLRHLLSAASCSFGYALVCCFEEVFAFSREVLEHDTEAVPPLFR